MTTTSKTIKPHNFIISLITRTTDNNLTEIVLTNHGVNSDFKSYDFTYDEKLSISKNAQKSLTFSMSRKLMRGYEWITNPFIKAVKIGSILKLEDRFGNHHFFTVTNISFEPSAANMSFKYQCKDSFSYQLTRQNDGYSIINDISSADYIGSRTIDFWANKIKEECYITDEYLPLDESLLLVNSGTTSSLIKKSSYTATSGNKVKLIKPGFVVTTADQSYADMHLQIPFALSGATANSALISLADQYGLMLQTAERLEKVSDKLQIKRYFWFEPTKNNQISGLKYSPEKNISSFNFSLEGNSLTTVLNVESKEGADGELISILPPISPFFKQYFSSSDWKCTDDRKYYPGMYTDIINGKIFKAEYDNSNYDSTIENGSCAIVTFTGDAKEDILELITNPFYNKISFTINDENDSFLNIGNALHYARASRYELRITYTQENKDYTILWSESRPLTQEQKNIIKKLEKANISIKLIVYTFTNASEVDSINLNIFLTYDFTQEDVDFAKIADECPWLENKIINFSYFLKTGVLTQKDYNSLMNKINNELRVINGKILYWSSEYYEALKKSADTVAKILSKIDSLSAYFNSEVVVPYENGRTPQSGNNFQKLYNEMWERSINKTQLFNLDDYQVEYANKYILAEQTFLKALYNFRKVFNSQYTNDSITVYNYKLTADFENSDGFKDGSNILYPIYLKKPEYMLYTIKDESNIKEAHKKENGLYIKYQLVTKATENLYTHKTDLQNAHKAQYKYDSKKTYGKLSNGFITEVSEQSIADWIIQNNINSFCLHSEDTLVNLSSIQTTEALKYFSPYILPRTTPYSCADAKRLQQNELSKSRGQTWSSDWVDYWRSYKASLPIKELEYTDNNITHKIKFIGQDLFTSQNAIGFSYSTFIEQLETAKSATSFPYYRRDSKKPFSITNSSELICFIDGTDVTNIGDKVEVLSASKNADTCDAYYPAYFVSAAAAEEYNKLTKNSTIDEYWDTSVLDKVVLTFSSKPVIGNVPLQFKDKYFKVLSTTDKMYRNKKYRRLYVDPNKNGYNGEYKNTVWGEQILKLIGSIHSQTKYYPLIAWSIPETEYLQEDGDEITPTWESSSNFFKDDNNEYFLILELMDYKEEKLTTEKLQSLRYPYSNLYYASTIKNENTSELNIKGTPFNIKDCVISLSDSDFYIIEESETYVKHTVNEDLDDDMAYFIKQGEEYIRVYTHNQAIAEEFYTVVADVKEGVINYSEYSTNIDYTPSNIKFTYYNNVFEEKTGELKWNTTDIENPCYSADVSVFNSQSEAYETLNLCFENKGESETIENITNGQFWYNYHDKVDNPSVFESAAAIEVDLSTYWTEAKNASVLCRYFIPDNWQPTIQGTPNGFADELYFKNDKSDVKNLILNNSYIPNISIVKDNSGSTLLPRFTLTKIENSEKDLASNIDNNKALKEMCNYLLDGDLSGWYVTEEGSKTYYTVDEGGVMWKDLVNRLYGLPGYNNFGGHYDMMFKYFSTFYSHMSFESYDKLTTDKQDLWRQLYNTYPSILLESKFSNENVTNSSELLQMAKLYFKDLSQPEKNYNISLIDTSLLDGYKGQEIKIGDAIQLQVEDYYDDLDDIYEILSQFLFVTDLNYSLRQNNISVTVNSIKYQEKLLQSLVKLIR